MFFLKRDNGGIQIVNAHMNIETKKKKKSLTEYIFYIHEDTQRYGIILYFIEVHFFLFEITFLFAAMYHKLKIFSINSKKGIFNISDFKIVKDSRYSTLYNHLMNGYYLF